jgi:hypothetical protein
MRWTEENCKKLVKKIDLAETNEVLNTKALAKYFGVSNQAIGKKVWELRQAGRLPKVDKSLQIDAYRRPYTSRELRFIIGAINAGQTCSQVAELLDRTYAGINRQVCNLIRTGQLAPRTTSWSPEQDDLIMSTIKLDANGCVDNYPELANALDRSYVVIQRRIYRLRKLGKLPPVTGPSIRGLEACRRSHQRIFAKASRGGVLNG